jgi:hypothetical protein
MTNKAVCATERSWRATDDAKGASHRFRIDIMEVVHTRVGVPPVHLVIEAWHPGHCLVRIERR